MKVRTIFEIVAVMAAIGILGMSAVAIPSVPQAHADKGGIPNSNGGDNAFKHCVAHPGGTNHCGVR
jgi:Tfp pilus assembly major pilin PilA